MRIQSLADTHGFLPQIPECDLFLLAGDIMPYKDHSLGEQQRFLDQDFRLWLEGIPAQEIIWISGNHDFLLETEKGRDLAHSLPGHFLLDSGCRVFNLNVWGTPWIPTFADWAFELEEEGLGEKFSLIPECDILISHTPPRGIGDRVGIKNVGSESLLKNLHKTRLLVCGHVHEGRGSYHNQGVEIINASYIDAKYRLVGLPPMLHW